MIAMMRTTKQLLYDKVSDARESCCGSSPKDKPILLKKLRETLKFASTANADQNILDKLLKAIDIVEMSKGYYVYVERLQADQILCDILNYDLKRDKKNEEGGKG